MRKRDIFVLWAEGSRLRVLGERCWYIAMQGVQHCHLGREIGVCGKRGSETVILQECLPPVHRRCGSSTLTIHPFVTQETGIATTNTHNQLKEG